MDLFWNSLQPNQKTWLMPLSKVICSRAFNLSRMITRTCLNVVFWHNYHTTLFSVVLFKFFVRCHFSATLLSSNTTSHYHLFSLIVPYITSRIFYCFSVSILTMYVLECVIVWGVSLSGSSGDQPTAGFSPWTSLSILGWKTTIGSEVAPHACCALIASELSVPTESRRTETQTRAALGCVTSDEARWASKTAAAVCAWERLMKTGSRGFIAQ